MRDTQDGSAKQHAGAAVVAWRERYRHLPWHRRFEFLIPALSFVAIYFVLLLPAKGSITAPGWAANVLVAALYGYCTFTVLTDPEKNLWLKNVLSLGIFALSIYLFFFYTTAQWDKLGRYFFNLEVMGKGDPFSTGREVSSWMFLLRGLVTAIKIFFFSAIFSTLLGLFIAVIRTIVDDKILNGALVLYVDIMRSIPILVMLIVVYSVLPFAGIVLRPLVSGVLTLAMIEGAYMSEVFRAGIQSIHHQQVEASRSLGLTSWQSMRYVVLPQGLRIVLPSYTGYLVGLTKGTALCSQIAIFELLKSAYQIQSWYVNATPLILASFLYLSFLIPLTRLSGALEKRWKGAGNR